MKTKAKEKISIDKVLKIQSSVLKAIGDFLHMKGLIRIMPVMLSPITDPLNHSVYDATIKYLDQDLKLTKSMILHKQIALAKTKIKGLYAFSPNIRLEKSDLKSSGRHLIEFTQVDIEFKDMSAKEFRSFFEDLIIHSFKQIRLECETILEELEIDLLVPSKPFKVFESKELETKYGIDFEHETSIRQKDFFWILDHKREFYDKEDSKKKGYFINYDLIYPEGFGEALSGAEREYDFDVLVRKIKERCQDPSDFEYYLKLSKEGKLVPSAGGGIGIERLVRFITKSSHIKDVSLFPKIPGEDIKI